MTAILPCTCAKCAGGEPTSPGTGPCCECPPLEICPRFAGYSGPDEWVMPEDVESLSLSIVCGPVTVIDCAGDTTVINEGCGAVNWAAPPSGSGCNPNTLCTGFRIQIPDGSAVYLAWTEVGCP